MKSPFKFLDAYDRQDKEIFFGRAEEIEQLYTLVFQTKLLLVYGQSGTGKTSLIQCGLANRFKPTDWFELFIRRKNNINASLHREIRRRAETPIADDAAVPEAIRSLYLDHLRPVYLIFDQFEELFILGAKAEQQAFIRTIAGLLKSDVACKIIFVMREEYIAMLYEFERAVPTLFNKRFRVEPMSLRNVQNVITGTTAAFGIELETGEATAQQIIDNLSDQRAGVQLSYLQVYLDKLYRKAARAQNGRPGDRQAPIVFTESLVRQTGALGDVMADFLEEQTAAIQKELAAKFRQTPPEAVQLILEEFATPEGTKQPVPRAGLSARLDMPDPLIDACLAGLEHSRILRNVEGVYELAHDTLAGRIDERRSIERKNLLKVQKLITDRYSAFDQTHTLLNKVELNYIEPYLDKLKLSPETAVFLQKSKSAAKRRQRQLIAGTLGIIAILAVSAIVAVVQMLITKNLKYYEGNFSQAKQFEEKAGRALQDQEPRELQKSWLYTLAALGQDNKKSLPLSQERVIRQGIAAGIYQQLWSSPGALSEIREVKFSPDGRRAAIACDDGTIRFCDMATGAEMNSLRGHSDSVAVVAFSPNGKWLVSASKDTIKFWDVAQDTLVKALRVSMNADIRSVAFHPEGHMLASSSLESAIWLWNLDPPGLLRSQLHGLMPFVKAVGAFDTLKVLRGHRGEVRALAFSPNGKWLASASKDSAISLWNVATGDTSTLPGHQLEVSTVAFSPDGRTMATGSKDKTIRLWNVQPPSARDILIGHRGGIRQVAFSPDGKMLASASDDSTIRIWDVASGSIKHSLLGHTGTVRSVAFSPDTSKGVLLLSGSSDRSIRLWEVKIGNELAVNAGHRDKINCVAFSPDDSLLASGSHDGTVLLWNRFSGEQVNRLSGHKSAVLCIAFSPDGRLLISGGEDKTVRVWDARSGVMLDSLPGHARAVNCVAMDSGASYIASGSADKTVRLWKRSAEASHGVKFIATDERLEKHGSSVRSVAFHPAGNLLVSGDSLGRITFWDLQSLKKITSWAGHDRAINALAFDHEGAKLASASSDDQIRIWGVQALLNSTRSSAGPWRFEASRTVSYKLTKRSFEKLKIKVPENVLGALKSVEDKSFAGEVAFMESIRYIIGDAATDRYQSSLSEDASKKETQELLVYDTVSGTPQRSNPDNLVELSGHGDDVLSVSFSVPFGTGNPYYLASGSADATIRIWDVNAASELAAFYGHRDKVYGVAFNHDPEKLVLASASWDKSIRLWDVQEICSLDDLLNNEAAVSHLAFSPSGRYLVSLAEDHRLRRWDIFQSYGGGMIRRVGGAAVLLSLAFTPYDSLLAYGAEDDFIRLWHMKSGPQNALGEISELGGHHGDGLSVAISRDGTFLASGSSDGKIRLWNLKTSTQKPFVADAHQDKVRSVAFSPEGNLLASAGSDKLIHLWWIKNGKLEYWKTYDGHKNGVWSIAFSPEGNSLASGSWDNSVHVWNFRIDRAERLIGHRGPVLAVAFSPDGTRLASGSWDQTVRLWEAKSGRELDVIRIHTAPVTSVAFDPAGKILASGAKDQTIRLRNLSYLSSVVDSAGAYVSAYQQDLKFLTSDSAFAEHTKKYLPFYNIFQAYSYLFAYRLGSSLELVEEPPKFYLKARDDKIFEPHKFEKLRRPRPQNTGTIKWIYENIPDSLRILRR